MFYICLFLQGLTETCPEEVVIEEKALCERIGDQYVYCPDPSGYRTGQGFSLLSLLLERLFSFSSCEIWKGYT